MDDSKLTTPLRAVITDAQTHAIRKEIRITGIVQGVGFRPYVYRYAIELPLSGTVLNNALGVTITLQGLASDIQHFIDKLKACPPPLARIDSIVEKPLPLVANEHGFSIIHSQGGSDAVVAVSADKCVCEDCLAECLDPSNRHYRYPFTNCTNCGPRYTIIRTLPYDRPNTAMAEFEMCDACAAAYRDPLNRRYHAQPVSCPKCGPQLRYLSTNGETVCREMTALDMCIGALKQGKIIAIKGLGGFHLVADATNDDAVALLRMRKHRPAKPFAVMVSDLAMAQSYATGSAF
ncbi:MAG TPA: acylphosphatase, partial [Pseudomonadales bacterium]|nr:acylphosphatase [Pseudomonadales bacterium]